MKFFLGRKGQHILEYAVIFSVIVGVIVVAVNKALRTQTCQIYKDMGNRMDQSSANLEDKFAVSPSFPVK
jgi:archaellum component FlaG (FlaF/FlaG flagellin family)